MNCGNVFRLISAIGLLGAQLCLAQKNGSPTLAGPVTKPVSLSIQGNKISYYSTGQNGSGYIAAPASFLRQTSPNARPLAPTAQFIVNYTNFTAEARRAFQYAVDIWSTLIVSPVPIRIQANWVSQEPNLLGSAGPASYRYSFDGSQKVRAFYPVALAEKIARRELNNPADPDIIADFNRNNNWYYGTDGKTPKGQTDLVTAVLHELAHGLGFIGFFSVESGKGDQGNGQYLADLPSVYDCFIENGLRKRLVTSQADYPNNSIALNRQLTGGDLYLNGTVLRQTSGLRLKLNAQAQFDRAANVYHLNEDTYPTGTINSLMSARLAQGQSMHTPGPLVLAFFSDLEWKTTSVLHEPVLNVEENRDFVFSVRVISDTTLTPGSVRLFYRKSAPTAKDTVATAVSPVRVGSTDEYRYILPALQASGDTWYYFQARDASERTFTNPGKFTTGSQTWHHMRVGPDNTPPVIQYSPSKYSILSTTVADSLPIYARIADDRSGIGAAYVEYQINGVAQPSRQLRYGRRTVNNTIYDSVYSTRIDFPANSLNAGDRLAYRIVARDSSRSKNQRINPATGFHELRVVAQQPVRDQYINTFDNVATAGDFAGSGFSLSTPVGFGGGAIHSEHPYRNGADFRGQSSFEYMLLSPIRIKANPDSAVIRFDEVVLMEPGTPGSKPGDATFYDYVIVEGSTDNGRTWTPLVDAYSSADKTDWLTAYKARLVSGLDGEQNSETMGVPALLRHRDIPILKPGSPFRAGDQLIIRFRLVSDQLAYGWGWAVDNLRIQAPPAPLVLAEEPASVGSFQVYPNPVTNGMVQLNVDLTTNVSDVQLRMIGPAGHILRQQILPVIGRKVRQQLDLSHMASGLYIWQLAVGDAVLTQKVMLVN
ncbi:T9SS type A sorting domain-containing protein [Spirosoma sp.]|uniref:T9SS type A sorting domain-containing protein n=1 Tax=Spirosoma sp. TaxID=1899569 RepID=UPI002601B52A|nr:T9SS type A sorting domain-containing protein [Spirosoma sp.]MCX6213160.1 T9SS type A sorting domain-containing protein [Spirosoma sp.]